MLFVEPESAGAHVGGRKTACGFAVLEGLESCGVNLQCIFRDRQKTALCMWLVTNPDMCSLK